MSPRENQTPPDMRDPSPQPSAATADLRSLTSSTLLTWKKLHRLLQGDDCIIDGSSLDIASVVAVAKFGTTTKLSSNDDITKRIDDSVHMLRTHLDKGHVIYGVSTGFRGSADSRIQNLEDLQRALIQHQNSGVLTSHDIGRPYTSATNDPFRSRDVDLAFNTSSMPKSWVKASMLIRCNSLVRGHSGVRMSVVQALLHLLNKQKITGLYQDRYTLRTASQWIGPQLEDLLQAISQIRVEINSTTDNPLMDANSNHVLHGGNFQAAVVTSTMDRARLCLERLGKMLFSQATEIINPMLNGGLPANLCADDPSTSFTCKGIDINMAAYQSELGFLANPVGNHVQSAEMHKQAISSLALISSRYTIQALDTIYLMAAAHLFILCQALDLRILQVEFLSAMNTEIDLCVRHLLFDIPLPIDICELLETAIYTRIENVWPTTNTADLDQRCKITADAVMPDIIRVLFKAFPTVPLDPTKLVNFTTELQDLMQRQYESKRQNLIYHHQETTPKFLGNAAKRMYNFIRKDLGIKLHCGLIEHPTQPLPPGVEVDEPRRTIGSRISVIYEALRNGRGSAVLMACAEEGLRDGYSS